MSSGAELCIGDDLLDFSDISVFFLANSSRCSIRLMLPVFTVADLCKMGADGFPF